VKDYNLTSVNLSHNNTKMDDNWDLLFRHIYERRSDLPDEYTNLDTEIEPTKEPEKEPEKEEEPLFKQKNKKKCGICKTKLQLVHQEIGKCKCGGVFCSTHRMLEEHSCQFDHKTIAKQKLAEQNQKVSAQKIIPITSCQ